jgi:uncharacterized protein YodC (DUF2158 family)
MAKNGFKVGDIVVLRSGGPEMTFERVGFFSPDTIEWQWFGGRKLEEGRFPRAPLEHVAKRAD